MSLSIVEQRDSGVRSPMADLTSRALVAGCGIGALLAAGNVYTGLKTAYVDGGSITAAVVAFALFGAKRAGSQRAFSPAENNLTQTIASSAAVMSSVTGVIGPIAALSLAGQNYPYWAIAVWGTALGALGIAIARTLRHRLITTEGLPFPSGRATGEVIEAMHAAGAQGAGRARVLLIGAIVAALVTWFRDARPTLLPQAWTLPWGHAGLTAASLWLGISLSPVMIATGVLIGPRGGVSVLMGTVGAWGVLAPLVLSMKWVAATDYPSVVGWLLWPGVALLISSALTALLLDWRAVLRGILDLNVLRGRNVKEPSATADPGRRFWAAIAAASIVVTLAIGSTVFGVHPLVIIPALAFSFVMAGVCARGAGETDIAPVGSAGSLAQLLFGAPSLVTSLFCGGVVNGNAGQTAQTLWAFKAGQRLQTNPHVQAIAQLLGLVVGAAVVVPVYGLMLRVYGLGTPTMPAPAAISWKATADAVQLGTAAMPSHAGAAAAIAFAVGVVLTLLGKTRLSRYLPSAVPIGIAFVIPAPLAGAIFVGSMVFVVLRAWRPTWTDEQAPSLAAGAIAGESLTGIVIAALLASGLLGS